MHSSKWHGSVTVPVAASVDRIWEIASDFCGLQKWAPSLEVCERVEGVEQRPGCVRYCAGNAHSGLANGISWVKEKLTSLDSRNHSYSYAVIDGNMGLQGYEVTFQVMPRGEESSLINWSFQLDPVANCAEEEFVRYLSSVLVGMARSLEELVLS